jgi:release factor glutamine methyltransferase
MLKVTPDVLDPRPDTETLVDWALEVWPQGSSGHLGSLGSLGSLGHSGHSGQPDPSDPLGRLDRIDRIDRIDQMACGPTAAAQPPRVLDLGTGSGAIALALKAAHPRAQVHACDASMAALCVAQANAIALGLPLALHAGHWWSAVSGLRFDLAVANPPYIREDDPHLAGLEHEPRSALVAAQEGLADLRAIIESAPAHLLPGAWLLLEHGHDQATAVAQALAAAGFADIAHRLDLAGHTRCTGGRLPG